MPSKKALIASAAAVLLACALAAQEKSGTIAGLEFQRPKSGMTKQYEEGRKLKAQWHKQQKDSLPRRPELHPGQVIRRCATISARGTACFTKRQTAPAFLL
jgi:hypothetical protein